MVISARTSIVFNIAAIVVGVSAVAGAVRYTVFKPQAQPCDTRYRSVMHFALERDGTMVTPDELQGRFGGLDRAILRNVDIARDGTAPKPVVLNVSLPASPAAPGASPGTPGVPGASPVLESGMQFPWQPRAVGTTSQACLAYNMRLSSDFDMTTNGLLPGISGANATGDEQFAVHLAWHATNEVGIASKIVTKHDEQQAASPPGLVSPLPNPPSRPNQFDTETTTFEFPRGRWMRVSQELILNKPEDSDGVLRIWIDGKLVLERTDMRLRSEAETTMKGIVAAARVLSGGAAPTATAQSTVAFTAYELYW